MDVLFLFRYFALLNCDKPSTPVKYSIHAWQADESWWSQEFSYNDRGINTLYLVFSIVYPFLFLLQLHSWHIHATHGAHHIIRLISHSIITETVGIILTFISYLHLAKNGRVQFVCFVTSVPYLFYMELLYFVVEIVGGLLMITSSTIFVFVLFLLAQGWIISTEAKPKYVNQMTIGCAAMWLLHMIFFFWRDHSGHSASKL